MFRLEIIQKGSCQVKVKDFNSTKLELQCLKNSDSILCHLMGQVYQHIFPSASPIPH